MMIIIIIQGSGPPPDPEGILLYSGLPRSRLCSDHNGKPITAEELSHHCPHVPSNYFLVIL